ncbi:MAG: hypothetical protein CSB47_03435 [Proteobacteria bacterium]|nr:MAG: hypothetical protein CSB47_03435 [Pseudomonadota bacterium]
MTAATALTLTLTVTDDDGATATDTVVVTVNPVTNQLPIAEAGAAKTVIAEDNVSLDGTNSTDVDGTVSSYSWTFTGSDPIGASVILVSENDAKTSFTAPSVSAATVLTFTLTVTDDDGATSTDTVEVTVEPIVGSLLINEISSRYYSDSAHWVEIYNPTNATIELANYTLRAYQNVSTSEGSRQPQEYVLPSKTIPPNGYLVIRADSAVGSNPYASENVIYLKDSANNSYFWWRISGFVELVHNSHTVDFIRFGSFRIPPLDSEAWTGGNAPELPSGADSYGYSLARDGLSTDTNQASDWVVRSTSTFAGPNDVTCNTDADADGIPDCSEMPGSTYNGLSLYDLGARTGQTDIFIEVDYVDSSKNGELPVDLGVVPQQKALERVAAVFADRGYVVHFDVGDLFDQNPGINPDNMDLGGGNQVDYSLSQALRCSGSLGVSPRQYKAANMDPRRRQIFFYMLFGTSQRADGSGGSSGCAETPGNDSLITLGGWTLSDSSTVDSNILINYQASTVMHEFGHNLGLKHGGFESTNYKPNYISIMNYLYQLEGLPTIGLNEGDRYLVKKCGASRKSLTNNYKSNPDDFKMDYSDGVGLDLDEINGVVEERGLGQPASAAVDFNCDGDTADTLVNYDVNPWDSRVGEEELSVLRDYDDWANIQIIFARTNQGDSGTISAVRSQFSEQNISNSVVFDAPVWDDVQPVTSELLMPPIR